MSDTVQLGINQEQRDMLLRGLRFVRSSVMLEQRDPGPEVDEDRARKLQQIASLAEQLQRAETADAQAEV